MKENKEGEVVESQDLGLLRGLVAKFGLGGKCYLACLVSARE